MNIPHPPSPSVSKLSWGSLPFIPLSPEGRAACTQYLFLGLLLTCLLLGVAAICLGVRCEYGCPPFPTCPKQFFPLLSPTAALPLGRAQSHYHHILSFSSSF